MLAVTLPPPLVDVKISKIVMKSLLTWIYFSLWCRQLMSQSQHLHDPCCTYIYFCAFLKKDRPRWPPDSIQSTERETLRVVLRRSEAQESLETFTENSTSAASRLARPDTPGSCYSGRKQDQRAKLKRVAEDKAPVCQ